MTAAAQTDLAWERLEEIDPAEATFPARAKLAGEAIVVLKTATGYRGVDRVCPHQKATMLAGIMMGNGTMVRCPKHNFIFRLTDGKGVNCVGLAIKVYPVEERDGVLWGAVPG